MQLVILKKTKTKKGLQPSRKQHIQPPGWYYKIHSLRKNFTLKVHNWTCRRMQKFSAIIHVLQEKNFCEIKVRMRLSPNSVLKPAMTLESACFFVCIEQHLANTAYCFLTAVPQCSCIQFLHNLYMLFLGRSGLNSLHILWLPPTVRRRTRQADCQVCVQIIDKSKVLKKCNKRPLLVLGSCSDDERSRINSVKALFVLHVAHSLAGTTCCC